MKILSINAGLEDHEINFKEAVYNYNRSIYNSFVDYDLFITDLGLINGDLAHELNNHSDNIFSRIKSGGILICFSGQLKFYDVLKNNRRYLVGNYNWLKEILGIEDIKDTYSSDIEFIGSLKFRKDDEFASNVCFICKDCDILANNKANHVVAMHKKLGEGHVFILPAVKNKEDIIKYFVKNILPSYNISFDLKFDFSEKKPEFLKNIEIEGEKKLLKQKMAQENVIEKENKKLEDINSKIEKLHKWKELIWQTGEPLEKIVGEFFGLLGLELKNDDDIDLVGKYKGKKVAIEVKGNTKCINHKKDFRQIMDRKAYDDKENPENIIAILVGNPYRENDLNKRPPDKNNHLFVPQSISLAEKNDIGLVSTVELLNALNYLLKNNDNKKAILLKEIMETKGIYKFKEYKC